MLHKKWGFTLIELLIVVAIIAILAAIAVPNFLEAQTRSKVSRAKADIRTVVTGLEAYRVDNNKYPYSDSQVNGLLRLTTPVQHLTSIPDDSFDVKADQTNLLHPYYPQYFFISENQFVRHDWGTNMGITPQVLNNQAQVLLPVDVECPAIYQIRSVGPNNEIDYSVPYDPTNGTTSIGDISYFGPGNVGLGF